MTGRSVANSGAVVQVIVAAAVAAAIGVGAQTPPQPGATQTPPTYRAGVNLIRLDVLALDKDRHPVRGLKAADFTVLENGKPQSIEAFTEIEVRAPSTTGANWTRDIGSDVASNDLESRRLVMIVMDDAYTGVAHGEPRSAVRIAEGVIAQLGPDDLAAVLFTYQGRAQNFTNDRSQLTAAVRTFIPKSPSADAGPPSACMLRLGGCLVDTLTRAARALADAPSGRKVLFLISGQGLNIKFNDLAGTSTALSEVGNMFQALQIANITVNTFDPSGLPTGPLSMGDVELDLAGATGGRRIVNTNAPELAVPEVFDENSSYYLIAYRSTNTGTGPRRTQVKVGKPGVTVRSRDGYIAQKDKGRSKKAPPTALDFALARGLPTGDLPLRVSTSAFAVPGRKTAEVVLAVGMRDLAGNRGSEAQLKRRIRVVATAFDKNWRSQGAHEQTIELTLRKGATTGAEYEVLSRLALEPGRYEVRVATEVDGRAGSTFVDIDVPNFEKDTLSMSGVLINLAPALPLGNAGLFGPLVPIGPTTARDLGRAGRATAFVRLYEGGKGQIKPVTMTAEIVDTSDRRVVQERTELSPNTFKARAADVLMPIPVASLEPGEYLLRLSFTLDKTRLQGTVRFSVR